MKKLQQVIQESINPEMFRSKYADVANEPRWNAIQVEKSDLYPWSDKSTYIQLPSFFEGIKPEVNPIESINDARVLLKLGDSVTTDHISPAGSFPADGPAGLYLMQNGVSKKDFNSFGSRRGNHEVMMRGTFANVRIRNEIAQGKEGGYTTYFPSNEVESVFDAAMKYKADGTNLVVLAGTQYGTGSSRDWAAKEPSYWVSKRSSQNHLSVSTEATWWEWVYCLCASKKGKVPKNLGLMVLNHSVSQVWMILSHHFKTLRL